MGLIRRRIFGKNVSFSFDDELSEVLLASLAGYADASDDVNDVRLCFGEFAEDEGLLSRNPASFLRSQRRVTTSFHFGQVRWAPASDGKSLDADVNLLPRRFRLKHRERFRTLEYSTDVELFEQLLHELVLIPAMYFFLDRVIVHSAAVVVRGSAILLTGTGGTGKTSGLLSIRREENVEFLTDDIGVMAPDGSVFPNLAWPKIYGYNLGGNIGKGELLRGRGWLDRLHFNLRHRINPAKVRRKLRPQQLYGRVAGAAVPLDAVFFLFRENVAEMVIEDLPTSAAVEMSLAVMSTEHSDFQRFFHWDRYNSLAFGRAPILDLEVVLRAWRQNLQQIFSKVRTRIVRIPVGMPHDQYLSRIRAITLEQA